MIRVKLWKYNPFLDPPIQWRRFSYWWILRVGPMMIAPPIKPLRRPGPPGPLPEAKPLDGGKQPDKEV